MSEHTEPKYCPICSSANKFEEMYNSFVYLIGDLVIRNPEKGTAEDNFLQTQISICRRYYSETK